MKRKILLTICLLSFVAGCPQTSPRRQLYDANIAFTHVCEVLKIMRDAEKISDAQWDDIKVLVKSGDNLLDKWEQAIKDDTKITYLHAFNAILDELIAYEMGLNDGQE